jgi:hypothetical protein
VLSALLVLSDASSFFCLPARFMLLGSFFTWVYFLLEFFFYKYPAERSGLACAVVTKRQQEVNEKYHKKAGELDLEQGTAPGSTGPFRKELIEYRHKGRVIDPVVGAFAEMPPDTYAIAGLGIRNGTSRGGAGGDGAGISSNGVCVFGFSATTAGAPGLQS